MWSPLLLLGDSRYKAVRAHSQGRGHARCRRMPASRSGTGEPVRSHTTLRVFKGLRMPRRVWSLLAGGQLLARLANHQKTVTSLCVAPHAGPHSTVGPRLLSGSLDGHVKVGAYFGNHTRSLPAHSMLASVFMCSPSDLPFPANNTCSGVQKPSSHHRLVHSASVLSLCGALRHQGAWFSWSVACPCYSARMHACMRRSTSWTPSA